MISNKDRSDWFGASDTNIIMGNWKTKTFAKWWLQKLGIDKSSFSNTFTMAGTHLEHRIIDSLRIDIEKDKQILLPELKLRINLDGNTKRTNYEVKTHKDINPFSPKKHIPQTQVQMFGGGFGKTILVSYALKAEDYKNYLLPIDKERLDFIPIMYNPTFIDKWLPRIKYLAFCLDKGIYPKMEDICKNL